MKIKASEIIAGLVLFALLTAPVQAADRHTLSTGASAIVAGWQSLGSLPATNRLRLAIGLPLRNRDDLVALQRQLYDRTSTNFHRYLTPDQFTERFGPSEQDYQRVMDFAKSNNLEVVGTFDNRAVVDVAGTVADLEKTFQVHLHNYQHPTENRQFFAPDTEPSIDSDLPILFIKGLDNYLIPRPRGTITPMPNIGSATNQDYMGTDFRNAYIPASNLKGAGQIVGLYEGQPYYSNDIALYESKASLPSVPLKNVTPNGPLALTSKTDTGECSLDIEMVISMAPALTQVTVYEGTNDVDIMNAMVSASAGAPLPRQIGCSFGIDTDTNIEQALLQMTVQGQSFLFASGDFGAFINATNAADITENYMTTVGGTELVMNGAGQSYNSESVWNNGGSLSTNGSLPKDDSGGGVFVNVPIPYYQQPVNMSANQGSSEWRNIPDVSMCADVILVVDDNGGVGNAQGTSAAAPLWAGFIALANEQAASDGVPPLGFLNPAIYQIGQSPLYNSCFNDITNGSNTNALSPNKYRAAVGYDLCTGWGSPKGINLVNALVGYAGPVFVNFNYRGTQTGSYAEPYNTIAAGINAINSRDPGGTIFIETAGSTSETPTINTPVTITANDGPATIGN